MAHLTLIGCDSARSKTVRQEYQRERWGRTGGNSLLLEFWPLPNFNVGRWAEAYVQTRIPWLAGRNQYQAQWRAARLERIQGFRKRPKTVLAYGVKHRLEYLLALDIPDHEPGQKIGDTGAEGWIREGTRVVIAPHPRWANRIDHWTTIGQWLAASA